MEFWVCAVAIAVISYIVGGVNGSIISSKLFFRKDIREYGSKNAGLTNFYRVFGVKGLVIVLAVDILKAALCAVLAGLVFSKFDKSAEFGKLCSGVFVIAGHIWPVFYGFKGGKGVLAGEVVVCVIDWRIGLMILGVFAVVVLLTRYVSLGSVLASLSFPILMWLFNYSASEILLAAICFSLIAVKHIENIVRLIKGKESKLSFGKK